MLRHFALISPLLAFLASAPADAENWPQWRGPTGNGLSSETGIATQWGPEKNVAWRLPLPGPGGATPVVWGDRIFVSTSLGSEDGADLALMCISTDGKKQWQVTVGSGNQNARVSEGNSASPTPVTDGKRVWVFFGTGQLACYTVDGEEVWNFNVQDRFGKFDIQFGMASTPVLDEGHLYMQLLHGALRGPYLVQKVAKLDAATGETVWAIDRPHEPGITPEEMFEIKHAYSSPLMYDHDGLKFLVTHGADATVGHSLEDGSEIWRLGAVNGTTEFNATKFDPTFRFVSSPTAVAGSIVVPTAKNGPTIALKVDRNLRGRIDGPGPQVRWVNDKTPDVCCPLIVDGLVYCVRKDGKVFCVELETGKELYYERTHNDQHRSSPIYADGHIYYIANDGHATVLKHGPTLEVVAENDLNEQTRATPVISNGTLYIRTYEALYAIRSTPGS